jgi:hypothetical protein
MEHGHGHGYSIHSHLVVNGVSGFSNKLRIATQRIISCLVGIVVLVF